MNQIDILLIEQQNFCNQQESSQAIGSPDGKISVETLKPDIQKQQDIIDGLEQRRNLFIKGDFQRFQKEEFDELHIDEFENESLIESGRSSSRQFLKDNEEDKKRQYRSYRQCLENTELAQIFKIDHLKEISKQEGENEEDDQESVEADKELSKQNLQRQIRYNSGYLSMNQLFRKQKYNAQKVWQKSWPLITFYVTRALQRFRSTIFYNRPQLLSRLQIRAIGDNSIDEKGWEDHSNRYDSWVFRTEGNIRRFLLSFFKQFSAFRRCCTTFSYFLEKISNTMNAIIPIFTPFGQFEVIWSVLQFFVNGFLYMLLPFIFCFQQVSQLSSIMIGDQEFYQIILVFLQLDMFQKMNTSFFWRGTLVQSRTAIIFRYIKRYFLLDLITFLCLTSNFSSMFNGAYLIFLIRMFYSKSIANRLREFFLLHENLKAFVDLMVLLTKVILTCHFFACSWYLIGDKGVSNQQGWVFSNKLQDESLKVRYIYSFYYSAATMSTVGNNIYPTTPNQMIFVTLMMFFSSALFGYTISTVGNIFNQLKRKREQYLQKLAQINYYMATRNVNPYYQGRARKYLQYITKERMNKFNTASHNLSALSKYLKYEIMEDIFSRSIDKIGVLKKNFSAQFLRELSLYVNEQVYAPEELVLRSDYSENPRIFLITKGDVELFTNQSKLNTKFYQSHLNTQRQKYQDYTSIRQLSKDQVFGQIQFFSGRFHPSVNVKSLGVTEVDYIWLSDFLQLLQNFPQDLEVYTCMQDSILLNRNFNKIDIFCYSCLEKDHTFVECPRLFYEQNVQRIIRNYNKETNLAIAQFQRGERREFRTLLMLEEIYEKANEYIEGNMDAVVNQESEAMEMDDEQIFEIVKIFSDEIKSRDAGKIKHSYTTIRPSIKDEAIQRFLSLKNQTNNIDKEVEQKEKYLDGDTSFEEEQSKKTTLVNPLVTSGEDIITDQLPQIEILQTIDNSQKIYTIENSQPISSFPKRSQTLQDSEQKEKSPLNNDQNQTRGSVYKNLEKSHQNSEQPLKRISFNQLDDFDEISRKDIDRSEMRSIKSQHIQENKFNNEFNNMFQQQQNIPGFSLLKEDNDDPTEKIKQFKVYFPHNNVTNILEQVNRPNIWKKILRLQRLQSFQRNNSRQYHAQKLKDSISEKNKIIDLIKQNTILKQNKHDDT